MVEPTAGAAPVAAHGARGGPASRRWLLWAALVAAVAALASAALGHALPGRWWAGLAKLVIASASALYLAWEGWRERRGTWSSGRRRTASIVMAVVGAAGWTEFGNFHFPDAAHYHDAFHYVIPARYFDQLGYTGLYDCALLASRAYGLPPAARDLDDNVIIPTHLALARAADCKRRFDEPRWRAFERDVLWFRDRVGDAQWSRMVRDHGFNGSPVWLLGAGWAASGGPLDDARLQRLLALDPLLMAVGFTALGLAGGLRVLALALLFLGLNATAPFYWTGGAFLRMDWLAATLLGLALLRPARPLLEVAGGAFLGYATLTRLFPGLLLCAIAARLLGRALWRGGADRAALRVLVGAALAAAVLVPASAAARDGGLASWRAFAANTVKHARSPLANNVGLRSLLAYRPPVPLDRVQPDEQQLDPWVHHVTRRRATYRSIAPLHLALLAAGGLLVLGAACRAPSASTAAVLGVALVPLALELTCYYYVLLSAVALIAEERRHLGVALTLLAAATQATVLGPTDYDLRYGVLHSAMILALTAWLAGTYLPRVSRPNSSISSRARGEMSRGTTT